MNARKLCICFLSVLLTCSAWADNNADQITDYTVQFDPSQYIDLDEIEVGMTGYGLTVFHGTEPERFTIEVIGILRQFGPKQRGIIIRVLDNAMFEQAAGVHGVSGSPVYLDGRLAGAMSFGWSYGEEPLYGVTPIRDMLQVRQASRVQNADAGSSAAAWNFGPEVYHDLFRRQLLTDAQIQQAIQAAGLAQQRSSQGGLTNFPLSMMFSGISTQGAESISRYLPSLAFSVGAGGSAGAIAAAQHISAELTPGTTLTIPLITGDMNGAILGTVTEVIGEQVYAFGHGWNSDGAARWPMATGMVHTFVSRTDASFKLGQPLEIVGAILADESTAVYGEMGAEAPMVPVTVNVNWENTGFQEDISAAIAQDELIDPVLATISLISSVTQRGGLPRDHTIDYHIRFSFDGMDAIEIYNRSSMAGLADIIGDSLQPLYLALNNPWQKVKLAGVNAEFNISHQDNSCMIEAAQLNQNIFRPGDTVNARLELAAIRGRRFTRNISLQLPNELPDGKYTIVLGDSQVPAGLIQEAQPSRASAFDVKTLHEALQQRLALRRNELYIGMIIQQPGIAIDNDQLPHLPPSRMMMLTDQSRRQQITQWRPLLINSVEMNDVVMGIEVFEIEVKQEL